METISVRCVPVHHIEAISLLGTRQPLPFTITVEEHENDRDGTDVLGEVVIEAPGPTGALIDVIAIDFDQNIN